MKMCVNFPADAEPTKTNMQKSRREIETVQIVQSLKHSISAVGVELFGSDCSPVNYVASKVNSPVSLNCHRDSSLSYHYVPPNPENITPPKKDQQPSSNFKNTDTDNRPPLPPTQSVEPAPVVQPQPPTAMSTPNIQQSVCSSSHTLPMPNKMKEFNKPPFKVWKKKAPTLEHIGSIEHVPKPVELARNQVDTIPEPVNNKTSPLPVNKVAAPVLSNNDRIPMQDNKEAETKKDLCSASSVLTPWGEHSSLLGGKKL